jgi:hypothetical protein
MRRSLSPGIHRARRLVLLTVLPLALLQGLLELRARVDIPAAALQALHELLELPSARPSLGKVVRDQIRGRGHVRSGMHACQCQANACALQSQSTRALLP